MYDFIQSCSRGLKGMSNCLWEKAWQLKIVSVQPEMAKIMSPRTPRFGDPPYLQNTKIFLSVLTGWFPFFWQKAIFEARFVKSGSNFADNSQSLPFIESKKRGSRTNYLCCQSHSFKALQMKAGMWLIFCHCLVGAFDEFCICAYPRGLQPNVMVLCYVANCYMCTLRGRFV